MATDSARQAVTLGSAGGDGGDVGGTGGVTVELDLPARMRDGVILRANVYRPGGIGPWPTLLSRSPYGKDDNVQLLGWLDPIRAARSGFMVVIQDTRGRFESDGDWAPFRFEQVDGFDSVEWAARLPGSNEHVGMFGPSYLGNTQWLAAIRQPPSLAAIAPALTWSDPLDGLLSRGGALELGLGLSWTLEHGAAHLMRQAPSEDERDRRLTGLLDEYDGLVESGYNELPIKEPAAIRRHRIPELGTFQLPDEETPARSRVVGSHDRVVVPTFHIGGWYDIFVQGTLDNYSAMVSLGRPARLVVGPWSHIHPFADPIGDLCFGTRASRLGVPAHSRGDLNDELLDWFRRYLVDAPSRARSSEEKPVRLFVMGRNEWRDESAWPLERAQSERWFLAADGAIRSELPSIDGVAEFVYDPRDPVPTVGGQILMAPAFRPGPLNQERVESRDDVLTFTSARLEDDLEVTGRVRAILHAESSSPSADWVVRLCDVHPDGRSFNVCDGILRVDDDAVNCRAYEIDLWSTSMVFLRGHRLRVQVTSSCFPRWDRNLNTGNQAEARFQAATQRVHLSPDRPSYIELPVVR